MFETSTTICVSIGSWPFSCAKIFTNTGTRNSSIPVQDERREAEDDDRVDHRALHAALDLRRLLDLHREPVEHAVERSRGLAGLDHRDVEAVEDRAGAAPSAFERIIPDSTSARTSAMTFFRFLSTVCSSRIASDADDVDAGLDQGRELAREDLQRLRVDLLAEARADGAQLLAGRVELLREQAALAQQVARRVEVGRVELALELDALGVDRRSS